MTESERETDRDGGDRIVEWCENNIDRFPDIQIGYCAECDEEETWIIEYDTGQTECYHHGCSDVEITERVGG
jgi:hypothetical protein